MSTQDFYSLVKEGKTDKTDFYSKAKPSEEKTFDFYSTVKGAEKPEGKETPEGIDYGYGLRQDKTQKGKGFFGEIPIKKGVMTELGSEVDIDLGNGTERLHYPLVVPSLTREEIDELGAGRTPSKDIQDKALAHALERKKQGLSPFATPEEEGKTKLPEREPFWKKFGKALSTQAQIAPPAETLPQMGAGFLEEISLGAIDVLPPTTDAGKFARATGKYALAFPLEMKGLTKLLSPFKWLGRILGTGAAGGAREAVKEYFKGEELKPKEIAKEALIWGTLEGAGELVISALQTKQAIDFISKASGKSKTEVAKFMANTFKTKWKEKFGFEPTERNLAEFVNEKPNEVAKVWEEATNEAKEVIVPPEVKEAKEVIKPKQEIYRGYGREEKGKVYTGTEEPILGEGKYYAFTEEGAKEFGPKIEKKELDLKNPLVINSDEQWKKLAKEAGWKYPNLTGLPAEVIKENTSKMNQLIKSKGYDGVIVNWDDSIKGDMTKDGKGIKTLRNVFDKPQVLIFEKPEQTIRTISDAPKEIKDLVSLSQEEDTLKKHDRAIASIDKAIKIAEQNQNETISYEPLIKDLEQRKSNYFKRQAAVKPEAVKEPVVTPTETRKEKLEKQKEYIIDKIEENQEKPLEGSKVKIEVPEDGTLKINNNPLALEIAKQRVEKNWVPKVKENKYSLTPEKPQELFPSLNYTKKLMKKVYPGYDESFDTLKIRKYNNGYRAELDDVRKGTAYGVMISEGKNKIDVLNKVAQKLIRYVDKNQVTEKPKVSKPKVEAPPKLTKPLPKKETVLPSKKTAYRQPVIGKEQAAKRSDIIKLFRKAFTDPIRLRKFRERASGIHKLWPKVTRLLESNDIETAAHEIGHNLHTTLYGGDAKTANEQYKNVKKELKKFEDELFPMAYKGAKKGTENLEGFAEFTRMYVTNPDVAKELAPKFYQKFEDTLDVQYPELKEALLEARGYYDKYLQGTPESRVEAQIAYPEKTNLVNNAGEWAKNPHKFDRVKTLLLDDLFPIKRVVAEAFGIKPVEVETLFAPENLYIAMRNLKSAVARTDIVVTHETFDYNTLAKTGEGYQPIIKELDTVKKYKEFNNFLVARRAIEKGGQGIQTGINKGDAIITYGKYKNEWGALAKRWDGFWDRLLNYVKDSGLISDKQYQEIKDKNLYYAPFQRDMGENDRMLIGGSGSQTKVPIKRMKGSTRDIIPPVEAGLKNIYSMMINAEKNRVGHILAKLANKQNVGKYIEAVPTPTKMTDKISREEVEKQLVKHFRGITQGKELADLEQKVAELAEIFPDAFTRFGATHYPAGENIVTVFKEGKPKYYEVSPELYETWVRGTSPYVTNMITKFLRFPARLLRAGAILNPRFMVNNVVRDTWERALFTKFGNVTKDPVGAVIDTVYQPLAMLMQAIGKQALYIEWMKSGGGMSTMQGSSRDSIVKHLDEIIKGFPIHKPLRVLRELAAWGEEANRIAEFIAGKKVYPDTREGKEMAAFQSRDVSIDFLKTGLLTKAINAIIPFFNVGLQGPDKLIRMMVNPKTRSRAILRLIIGITIPSIILWWLNKDDKEIKELPDTTRDRNFVFKIRDKIYKIPVPFEAGIISHGLTQRMMDYMMLRDPEALKGFMGTVIDAGTPNIIPTLGLPFMETIANKNFFTGKRIIPFQQEQLISRYQYKTNTSLLARETGRILSYILGPDTKSKMASPAIIDHFINAWTGGLGRIATNIIDMGLEKAGLGDKIPKPEMPITQKLGLDAFVVRHPHSGAKSIERFYDNYKDYVSRKKSYDYADKMEADTEEQIGKGYQRIDKIYDGDTLKQAYDSMKMCQKEINGIYQSEAIDPKMKREMIDDLYDEMIKFARAANEDIKRYRLDVKGK